MHCLWALNSLLRAISEHSLLCKVADEPIRAQEMGLTVSLEALQSYSKCAKADIIFTCVMV